MKVLCAIDYSKHSKNAITLLKRMHLPAGSEVYLLHVNTPEEWSVSSVSGRALHLPAAISSLRAKAARHALEVLGQLEQVFRGQAVKVHQEVVEGNAGEEILKAIKEKGIDLVVVGSRGLSTVTGFLLGSVSEWVLGEAPCSVLVGRPQARQKRPSRGMRILLATDGSADARAAVDFLTTLTFPGSSTLILVHVVRKHVFQTEQVLLGNRSTKDQFAVLAEKMLQDRGRKGVALFEQAKRRLAATEFTVEECLVSGHEAQEILKVARRTRADVIVLGSRGLTGLRRLLIGSVSHKVVRNAPCSVLVIRQPTRKRRGPERSPA
ncbi:MAG: universal stress protein [Nitrospira sp.]|nr:universal stress protein [Nitrospira sp.]MCA9474379.1 universal stress protein [Nitrospira sp.]HQU28413.1 universal stress protein [Nitrospirales bacterium]